MRVRSAFLLALAFVLVAAVNGFGQQSGEIYGKVTDASGGVMPGVTVTLTSPTLLQPMIAVSGESGAYRFPALSVGVYKLTFEMPGFNTIVREGVRMEIGANVQINAVLQIARCSATA